MPDEPRPLLAELGDVDRWLAEEDVAERTPFLVAPDGSYDVVLNSYFTSYRMVTPSSHTRRELLLVTRHGSWTSCGFTVRRLSSRMPPRGRGRGRGARPRRMTGARSSTGAAATRTGHWWSQRAGGVAAPLLRGDWAPRSSSSRRSCRPRRAAG
jgi:hypothetical protein